MDSVDTLYANTRNNPIEDIETHVPLRVNRYELRTNGVAAGRWRGGISVIKEFAFLADGMASSEGDGHAHRTWGFQYGSDGVTSQTLLRQANGEEIELPSMLPARPTRAGDCFVAIGGSGGGYGAPSTREARLVLDDYLDEFITRDEARTVFGVIIADENTVDAAATTALRVAAAQT